MSTTHSERRSAGSASSASPSTSPTAAPITPMAQRVVAILRIAFGLTFLWAFFDKLLALGFSTGRDETGAVDRFGDAAWIHGGSPTNGFLSFGADGPFDSFYHSIAGAAWADWLFMLGLLAIGTGLVLGVAMRATAAAGTVLYLMMWTVVLPPETNPLIDDHILGALTLIALALLGAGTTWGLGRRWAETPLVEGRPWLR